MCEQLVTHTLPVRVHSRVVVAHRDYYHSANSKQPAHNIAGDGIANKTESCAHLHALQLSCRNPIRPIMFSIDTVVRTNRSSFKSESSQPPSVCIILTFPCSNTRTCRRHCLPSLRAILRNKLTPRINCANETKYIT